MHKIKFPIIFVTGFIIVYNALFFFSISKWVLFFLFSIAPIALIWMVYKILKFGKPSQYSWDEYFYEDHEYKRNGNEV